MKETKILNSIFCKKCFEYVTLTFLAGSYPITYIVKLEIIFITQNYLIKYMELHLGLLGALLKAYLLIICCLSGTHTKKIYI